jgi:RNA polymerase sigma-70 factor (ECF subfamily)
MSDNYVQIFEKEIEPHYDALYTFAYHLCRNQADAADLLQETILKAWKSMQYYEQGTNAKAWLFKILKNNFINSFNRKKRKGTDIDLEKVQLSDSPIEEMTESETQTYTATQGQDMRDSPYGDEVTIAIHNLEKPFREVLMLSLENFKYDEIAEILNIKVGTVRSRLHRARETMRKLLKDYAETQGIEADDETLKNMEEM